MFILDNVVRTITPIALFQQAQIAGIARTPKSDTTLGIASTDAAGSRARSLERLELPSNADDSCTKPNGRGGSHGGRPPGYDPYHDRIPGSSFSQDKYLSQKVVLGLAFLGSAGLSWLTHVKEDLFGFLTKGVKIVSIFVALFTGAVGLATCIAKTPSETTGSMDFGQIAV